jgi:large subunit ribosomal protein L9
MKLILTQEVSGLGSAGDVVDVRDGYGRNYLIPRGFGMRWTRGGEKEVERLRRGRASREIRDLGEAQEMATRIAGLTVTLPVRAGRSGRLFGSVTSADIAGAVKNAGGPEVDKRRIELGAPIKTLGQHRVSVRLHEEVLANVDVEVVAES